MTIDPAQPPACDKPNMRLWVAEIRSGRWPQDVGYLRTNRGLCCLGIACEAAIAAGLPLTYASVVGEALASRTSGVYTTHGPDGGNEHTERYELPPRVARWLGIPSNPIIALVDDPTRVQVSDGWGGLRTITRDQVEFQNYRHASCDGGQCQRPGVYHIHAASANDELQWPLPVIADAVENYYRLLED